jgi:hypothetical protein
MTRHQKTYNVTAYALAFALVCWVFATFFASCTTQRKVEKWNDKHPVKAAAYCTETFPVIEWIKYRDTTLFDTVLKPGETRIDTVITKGDTVIIKRECPPSQTITKTVTKEKEIRVRDSAWALMLMDNINQLEGISADKDKEIAIAKDRLGEAKKSRNWWMWACLLTWGVCALYVVLKLRAKLPF